MQTLRDFINSVTAANIVDIGIIAALIYFMLAWFTWTRAVQILVTLVAMGFFYFSASQTGLVLTSLLFQYLWAALIMVLVIVFQPEIRTMLDRASPLMLWSGRARNVPEAEPLEEVLKAVGELARLRLGALIVFQRVDGLDNMIVKGKTLDSLLSSEAVVMVFQKSSPLHDGAILISGNRIKAASCILPLSADNSLSSRYGTRHRAALGLTERSDALCLVVSEERGEVSLVENQEITNYRKKEDLFRALQRGLLFGRTRRRWTFPSGWDFLKRNWRLRILALFTAVLLWVVIVGPQRAELGLAVPIQYGNLPPGMELTGKWMDKLEVRVRGSKAGLANLSPGSVRAVVDLSRAVTGLNYYRISERNVVVPPGITIAKIRPSDLHLNIEASSVRKIRVHPRIIGTLPKDLKVVVVPIDVKVRALEADLKRVTSVITEPLKVETLLKKGKMTVPVMTKPEGIRTDSVEPARVTVTVEATPQ